MNWKVLLVAGAMCAFAAGAGYLYIEAGKASRESNPSRVGVDPSATSKRQERDARIMASTSRQSRESIADDRSATSAGAAESFPVLAPDEENRRILKELSDSGPAVADELDRLGRDVVEELVTGLLPAASDQGSRARVEHYQCTRAGCTAEVVFASVDEYEEAQPRFQGLSAAPTALARWPGPRAYPPIVEEAGRVRARIVLFRPDMPAM